MSLMPRPLFFGLLLMLSAGLAHAEKGAFTVTGEPDVAFKGKAVGMKLVGRTKDLTCKDQGQKLVFEVNLDSLKTGIELRDKHMTEKYLETAKYPKATLTLDKSQLVLPASGNQKGDLKAKLKIRGTTKEVPVTYEIRATKAGYTIKATMPVNYKDFGIEVPSYMGVTVKPDLDVEVAFQAKGA